MKNIILCSDGTGNAGGRGFESNVWRLFTALDLADASAQESGVQQIAIHDDGVGTQEFKAVKSVAGAFGLGLKRNVRELYRFLIRNYTPGQKDQIYIFGFSRGAYTARMLAELISLCGIINPEGKNDKQIDRLIHQAFEILRTTFLEDINRNKVVKKTVLATRGIGIGDIGKDSGAKKAEDFAEAYCHHIVNHGTEDGVNYLIRFVGVWDTVPAYGFPVQELADFWNYCIYPYKFDNRKLHPRIRKAVQALAIDESRKTFRPMLWEYSDTEPDDRLEQVWFPGVHAAVGGGYPKDGLAYISLSWMIEHASATIDGIGGLKFVPHKKEEILHRANPYAKMYDSRSGLGVFYRFEPRNIDKLSAENNLQGKIKIHPSVVQRIQARTENYAPGNIPQNTEVLETDNQQIVQFMNSFGSKYDERLLLPGVRHLVGIRQYLHIVKLFIVFSVILVGTRDWIVSKVPVLSGFFNNASQLCGVDRFVDVSNFAQSANALFPMAEKIYNRFLAPIVGCNNIFLMFIACVGFILCVGYFAKRKMRQKHSRFWTMVLGAKNGKGKNGTADNL